MIKRIVAHQSVDIDAISAMWLILRYFPKWESAEYGFVPAEKTWEGKPVDGNDSVIHVDTGKGRFDHHQRKEKTSATKLVYEYCVEKGYVTGNVLIALERMVEVINDLDHFGEVFYPEPEADRYEFMLHQDISELKGILKTDEATVDYVCIQLDAILRVFHRKIHAEQEIHNGHLFQSYIGKSILVDTANNEVIKLAQKMGYDLVIRFEVSKGIIRIKCLPKNEFDLTPLYQKLKEREPLVNWFLHISTHMLFNSSMKSDVFIPSHLTATEFLAILASI